MLKRFLEVGFPVVKYKFYNRLAHPKKQEVDTLHSEEEPREES